MADKADINFDRELRAKLLSGVEPVDDALWAGVQNKLAAAKRHTVAVIWWRRASIAFSAAAAILLGVFLFRPGKTNEPEIEPIHLISSPETPLVAMAEEVPAQVLRAASSRPQTFAVQSRVVVLEDSGAPVVEEPADDQALAVNQAPADDQAPAVNQVPAGDQAQADEQALDSVNGNSVDIDPFAISEAPQKQRRASSWSITASGNVQNNRSEGSASNAMRSAGAVDTEQLSNNGSLTNLGAKNFGIPLTFGVGVIKTFPSRIGIGTGLNYSMLPRTFRGTYTPEGGEGFEADIAERQHFVGIPLNLFYEVVSTKHFSFHVFAGGEGEKLVSRNLTITPESGSPVNLSESAKGLQWSVGGGIGMEFKITPHVGLYLDPGVRYYFPCGQPTSIRTLQPFMLNLEAGLRIDL